MQTIAVDIAGAPYDILIGEQLLAGMAERVRGLLPIPQAAIVTNTTVGPLYADRLAEALRGQGIQVETLMLPDGEAYKTMQTIETILDWLLAQGCERKTTLIALGGGVVGDMTGFAAAIYQRGIPFIQVPTTLLAQVDSSVGGKTGVNHPRGKNMVGAFYQPRLVLADLSTLRTLPDREYAAGLAEIIKYGLIDDLAFFEWLEANMAALKRRDAVAVEYAVARSCSNKARIVGMDEKEQGVRALLNLGHTFGHAIESGLGYGVWLHGEAVAAGMVLAAEVSQRLGHIAPADVARIKALIAQAGLPSAAPELGFARWMELMSQDKKVEAGRIRFVLMRALGESYIGTLDEAVLKAVLR